MDFRISEKGKRIETKAEVRAFDGDYDVTDHLRLLGLSPNPFPDVVTQNVKKLSPANRQQLEKDGLIEADESQTGPGSPARTDWSANWTMNVRYYWKQRFPAHGTVELVQMYRPIVGGSYVTYGNDVMGSIGPYCGGLNELREIAAFLEKHPVKEQGETYLGEHRIDYILTTANNWSGPIR